MVVRRRSTSELANPADRRTTHCVQRFVGRHSTMILYNADCLDVLPIACDAVVTAPALWNRSNWIPKPAYDRAAQKKDGWICMGQRTSRSVRHALNSRRSWQSGAETTIRSHRLADGSCGTSRTPCRQCRTRNSPGRIKIATRDKSRGQSPRQMPSEVGHPTQKPVRVMAWTLEQLGVPKGATVLNPYMGSGTTGMACIRLGMNFIGIERDAAHYKTACDRIAHELDDSHSYRSTTSRNDNQGGAMCRPAHKRHPRGSQDGLPEDDPVLEIMLRELIGDAAKIKNRLTELQGCFA